MIVLYWSTLIRYNGELDYATLWTAGGNRMVLKKLVSGYCLLINSQGRFCMIFSFPAGILKSDEAKVKQLKNQPYVGKLEIEPDSLNTINWVKPFKADGSNVKFSEG